MDQITNLIIVALVLIILIVLVMTALMKRAKNDPESLKNTIVDVLDLDLDLEMEEYNETRKAEVFSRDARPKVPDPNDYRYWLAVMEARRRADRMNDESIEDMELW